MPDKIENVKKETSDNNQSNSLSNFAFDLMKGAAAGAGLGAATLAVENRDKIVAGIVGGGAVIVGAEIAKENKQEIKDLGNAVKAEAQRQLKEITDTPKDVMNHIQKRPITSIAETIIAGPVAPVIHAKLAKWLGY